jgi:hypothetical protein
MLFARLASTIGLIALTTFAASTLSAAETMHRTASPETVTLSNAYACNPKIQFPQGKEELSRADIRLVIDQYLLGLGLETAPPQLRDTEDGTVVATLGAANSDLGVEMEIDPATGQLVDVWAIGPTATEQADYSARLRHHVMGDGKTWGDWVGKFDVRLLCGSDYGTEAPAIPEASPR